MPKTIVHRDLLEANNVSTKNKAIYTNIWKDLNEVVTNRCIEDGMVDFPFIGHLQICRYKIKVRLNKHGIPNIPVNWGKTNAARKAGTLKSDRVIYSNKKYVFKFKWKRPYVKNIKSYSFTPSRTNDVECKSGFLNRFYTFLSKDDTNYLKYPLKN